MFGLALMAFAPPLGARGRRAASSVDRQRVELLIIGQSASSRSKLTAGQRREMEQVARHFRKRHSRTRKAALARYLGRFDEAAMTPQNMDAVLGRVLSVTWGSRAPKLARQVSHLARRFGATERKRRILRCSEDARHRWRTPLELAKAPCSPRSPTSAQRTNAKAELDGLAKSARNAEARFARRQDQSVMDLLFAVFGDAQTEQQEDSSFYVEAVQEHDEAKEAAGGSQDDVEDAAAAAALKAQLKALYLEYAKLKAQCSATNQPACLKAWALLNKISELEAQLADL